MNFGGDLELF